jgi:single-stranded DNA-binding protein
MNLLCVSGNGDKAQTIWLDCSLWGKQAESGLINYLKKGQFVVLSGELGTREHEGKTYLTLRVANVTLGGKSDSAPAPQQPQQRQPQQPAQAQQQGFYNPPQGQAPRPAPAQYNQQPAPQQYQQQGAPLQQNTGMFNAGGPIDFEQDIPF